MSRRLPLIALAVAVLAGSTLTACESTQDKAKALKAIAVANAPKPLTISKPDKDVQVTQTTLLHDENGDAVVLDLKNNSNQVLVNVPILVDLRDAKGTSVYKNDTPGLDPSLNHVALLKPGETFSWVNDQVQASTTPKTAKVTIGEPEGKAPPKLPELEVSQPRLQNSNIGAQVSGTVTNRSQLDQLKLVVYAVARSGGKVVAAGRGGIKALKVGASPAPYKIFFIGNPQGADVSVEAPPTVLQ